MNHPKGEESTRVGDPCSTCTTYPHRFCTAAEPSPEIAAGADISKGRTLCGGIRPSLFRKGESRAAGFVRWSKRDAPDRADRDDVILNLAVAGIYGQRQEAVARLPRERHEGQPLAVSQLHLHVRPLHGVCRGVALELPVDLLDEVGEGRLSCARDPEVGAQKSFVSSSAPPAPNRSRPSSVMIRPRGVRCRKPSWRRYGS